MADGRLLRILELMSGPNENVGARRLCDVAAEITQLSGAGIMIFDGDLPRGSICSTNDLSALIENLQYTLGEGPCVDAHALGEPVFEADLANPADLRWPGFRSSAADSGVRAVFGFPVHLGAARLGALNLYRDAPGLLSDDQHADALIMADVIARSILALQAGAAPDSLSAEFASEATFIS